MNKYKIFCDMDGVLVDFNKGYYELTGIDIGDSFRNDVNFWNPINKAGYDFWINLEWMPDGKTLWDYIKKYEPLLLSAPSNKIDSRIGKRDWVKRELPGVRLILRSAEHKKDLAAPTGILIDDRLENVNGWKSVGGIGIHHTSTSDTIKELKKLRL